MKLLLKQAYEHKKKESPADINCVHENAKGINKVCLPEVHSKEEGDQRCHDV